MSVMVVEVYTALKSVGVADDVAQAAAAAVVPASDRDELVTKSVLRAELSELKAELIKWNVGTLIAMTGIFSAIVGMAMRFLR